MKNTKEAIEVTNEYLPVTLIETVGEYNAEADTILVTVQAYKHSHKLFVQPLSDLPSEMREAAKSAGYKFWAKTAITDISVGANQESNESLKLSNIEPMGHDMEVRGNQ